MVAVMPLTELQKTFAEDNHNLIYGFLNKHSLSVEDWYDIAAIGFCKAVTKYDSSRNSAFPTFAYFVMLNDVRLEMRREKNRSKHLMCISIFEEHTPGLTYEDCLGYEQEFPSNNPPIDMEVITASLSEMQIAVLTRLLEQKKQKQIAKELGVSQPQVSRMVRSIRETVKITCLT